jgi:hypothetical protein
MTYFALRGSLGIPDTVSGVDEATRAHLMHEAGAGEAAVDRSRCNVRFPEDFMLLLI